MFFEELMLLFHDFSKFKGFIYFFLFVAELTDVTISLYINRISAVDENKEEISFDVFLQVTWTDKRIELTNETNHLTYVELLALERHKIWVSKKKTYKSNHLYSFIYKIIFISFSFLNDIFH